MADFRKIVKQASEAEQRSRELDAAPQLRKSLAELHHLGASGIPASANAVAYDSIQRLLVVRTFSRSGPRRDVFWRPQKHGSRPVVWLLLRSVVELVQATGATIAPPAASAPVNLQHDTLAACEQARARKLAL